MYSTIVAISHKNHVFQRLSTPSSKQSLSSDPRIRFATRTGISNRVSWRGFALMKGQKSFWKRVDSWQRNQLVFQVMIHP